MEEARRLAAHENTTLSDLVEQGLRKIISDRNPAEGFRLRRATFKGQGLQPPLQDAGWERIREISHEGRSG